MGYTRIIQYNGLTIQNAYHRIDTTSSADGTCTASVNSYVSREARSNGEGYLTHDTFQFPLSYGSEAGADKNQAYDYLLGLPENADAVPVFEENQLD